MQGVSCYAGRLRLVLQVDTSGSAGRLHRALQAGTCGSASSHISALRIDISGSVGVELLNLQINDIHLCRWTTSDAAYLSSISGKYSSSSIYDGEISGSNDFDYEASQGYFHNNASSFTTLT